MGKTKSSNSSSSISSNTNHNLFISTASSFNTHQLPTDLSLGLTISSTKQFHNSFFVKVYMEGIPIGRKLNILAHQSYHELVKTLEHMFDTTILWGNEMDEVQPERCHVLTYEDEEGDLVMVGDVPWEMFLSTVKRLKITRVDTFGC
ncbi:Iaa20p [Trifolium repens]|nr:auxin-responsive protein IAA20 [Trifolium repens]WJX79932.1 Iaa20p [Trifolium repens]